MKIFFLSLLMSMNAWGAKVETTYLQSTKLAHRLVIKGEQSYKVEGDIHGLSFKLTGPWETPVDILENFQYPQDIFKDMEAYQEGFGGTEQFIKKSTHAWGKQYEWSTPSSGSLNYVYVCPKNSKSCARITHAYMEKLSFSVENFKK